MNGEIASLFATVSADIGDFQKAMGKVKDDLSFAEKGFGDLQKVVGTGLKMAAGVGVAAIGGVAAGMVKAVSGAADLEQQAANISAVFGDMAPPVNEVKDAINALALDPSLVVGVNEAGAGIEMLAKNGLTWDQIASGAARSSILLANATGTDLATSADLTTNALGIFGLEVSALDGVVATFTNAANQSQFAVEDWGYVLSNAGPKADSMGWSLEELFAAVTLTSSGFSGGQTAGTSWAWMVNGLTPSTDKATQAMKDLGLMTEDGTNAFFNADGSGKSLKETIALLQGAFGGLTTEQQMSYSETLFGSEAYGALSGALGINLDQLDQLIPKMTDFSAVEAGAETRTSTFSAAMSALNDTVGAVFTMVGDKFLPVLTMLARTFADFIKDNAPAVVEFFGNFADRLQAAIPIFERGVFVFEDGSGILMSFLEVLGMSGDQAQWVGQMFWDFRERVQAFLDPIGELITKFFSWQDVLAAVSVVIASIVIPAIAGFLAAVSPAIAIFAGLVAASALLRNAWENDWLGIRTALMAAWEVVTRVFNEVWGEIVRIVERFKAQWAVLEATNATLGEKLALIWQSIKAVASMVWAGIVQVVAELLPPFWAKLQEWGAAAWQWIVDVAPIVWEKLKEWGAVVWKWVTENLPQWIAKLGTWAQAAWGWIVEVTPTVLRKLGEWGAALWGWVVQNAPTWMEKLGQWAQAAWQWIVDVVPIVLQKLGEWGGQLWQWVVDNAPTWGEKLWEWAKVAWDWLTGEGGVVSQIASKMTEWGTGVWGWVTENAGKWGEKLKVWGDAAWKEFGERFPKTAEAMETAWTTAQDAVVDAIDYFKTTFAPLGTAIKDFGRGALDEIVAWATGNETEFTNTQKIWETAQETFGTVFTDIGDKLKEWGELAWEWFKVNFPQASQALTDAFDGIKENFGQFWDAVKPLIDKVIESFNALVEGWTTGSGEMSGALQVAKDTISGIWTIMIAATTLSVNTIINTLTLVAQLLTGDWAGAWETAKEIVGGVLTFLDTTVETVLTTVGSWFGLNKEDISTWYDDTKQNISDWWSNFSTQIATRDWAGIGSNIMKAFDKTGIKSWYDDTTQKIKDWWNNFKTWIVDQDWYQAGVDVIQGFWNGLKSLWEQFDTWWEKAWSGSVSWAKDILGIASPSKVFYGIGQNLMEGMRNGIDAAAQLPLNAMSSLATQVQGKVSGMLDSVKSSAKTINDTINSIKTPTTPTPTAPPVLANPNAGSGMTPIAIPQTPTAFAQDLANFGKKYFKDVIGTGLTEGEKLQETVEDFSQFGRNAANAIFAATGQRLDKQTDDAVQTLMYGAASGRVDELLAAVQTLVQRLGQAGLGTTFNISSAPNAGQRDDIELEQLVTYLNALYG